MEIEKRIDFLFLGRIGSWFCRNVTVGPFDGVFESKV